MKNNDTEYHDYTITKVDEYKNGDLSITTNDGWCFFLPKSEIVPKIGSSARFYGGGLGATVRGVDIDGAEVFYRTPEQQQEKDEADRQENYRKRVAEYEEQKDELQKKQAGLPEPFRRRIDGFQNRNPKFWEYEPYEIFVCQEAVKILDVLKTLKDIEDFYRAPIITQKELVPTLAYDDHSGNTFGQACFLARVQLELPEMLADCHGALCPMVGCKDYGCKAASKAPPEEARDGIEALD